MQINDMPFTTPQDVKEFIAECGREHPELVAPLEAIYAAGILHVTEGLIVAVEVGVNSPSPGDSTNVH